MTMAKLKMTWIHKGKSAASVFKVIKKSTSSYKQSFEARFQYIVRDNPNRIVTHVFDELLSFQRAETSEPQHPTDTSDIARQLTLMSSQLRLTSKSHIENERSRDSIINPHQVFDELAIIDTKIINYLIQDTKEDEFQNDAATMEGKFIELSLDDSVEEEDATKLEEESDNKIFVQKLQELEGFEMVLGHAWMTTLA